MVEVREAADAFSRMSTPDQQVIAAAISMMLAMYAGLREPRLDAKSSQSPKSQSEKAS